MTRAYLYEAMLSYFMSSDVCFPGDRWFWEDRPAVLMWNGASLLRPDLWAN